MRWPNLWGRRSEPQPRSQGQSRTSSDDLRGFANLAGLGYMTGLETDLRNHRRMEALGDAQLREHFPHYKPPGRDDGDDMGIQYQSPTTVHYHQRRANPLASAALMALLGTSGVGAGALLTWGLSDVFSRTAPTSPVAEPGPDADTRYGIELINPD